MKATRAVVTERMTRAVKAESVAKMASVERAAKTVTEMREVIAKRVTRAAMNFLPEPMGAILFLPRPLGGAGIDGWSDICATASHGVAIEGG